VGLSGCGIALAVSFFPSYLISVIEGWRVGVGWDEDSEG
jgi:hypothetical protein